jgi:hypothetical protein
MLFGPSGSRIAKREQRLSSFRFAGSVLCQTLPFGIYFQRSPHHQIMLSWRFSCNALSISHVDVIGNPTPAAEVHPLKQ